MTAKKEALSQFHRGQILAAAKTLFTEKGVEGASMDDIAAKADYSKSTIYVYFTGKEDILYGIVLDDMRLLGNGIAACLKQHDGFEARYFAICDLLVSLAESDPTYMELVLGKISVDETDFARLPVLKEIYDVGEETNRLIERMIREAVESGFAEASVNPAAAGMVFWSGICGLISISANKEAYFSKNLGLSRKAFLQYGFEMLLNSVRKKENK
ncbi:MAG: TetR/AcrR family transcriptional regulator [Clostridiaceae bacterium]